ncbi:MAG: hypothetical protein JWP75_31, partial [Frondihabitans sp.]|nr:hypothetical protein [Frondihabitans sp.]
AEAAVDLIEVDYDILPAVFDPRAARLPGAPLLHGEKDAATSRIAHPEANVVAEIHGEYGDADAGLAEADAIVTGVWSTQRVTHAQIETHASIGWIEDDGRLTIRTSSQVPFLVRDELARVFEIEPDRLRVFTARVGGGFGGKQEILTEDLVALAVLATGRPVQYEFTRSDEFTASTVRHPMRVEVTVGAKADGTLTGLSLNVLSDTGAYGNHGPGVLYHGCSETVSAYNIPNKRIEAQCVYTNNVPSGAFRGYGLGQILFGIESALDELARKVDMDPLDFRLRNAVTPDDPLIVTHVEGDDLKIGSYGLPECIDLARTALSNGSGEPVPEGSQWRTGVGTSLAMIATMPPRGHYATASVHLLEGGRFRINAGTAEFGNGTTTVHTQIVASIMDVPQSRITLVTSDTDATTYDTGAFGSAGTVVAGRAVHTAATSLHRELRVIASRAVPRPPDEWIVDDSGLRTPHGDRISFDDILALAGGSLSASDSQDGSKRSLAFNVQGFRVAVNEQTGEVRILKSVQAVDAGFVLNPEQLRGQIEGGVAQALGTSLYEEILLDETGAVTTSVFRNYHIPSMADVPETEVLFADTLDDLGPFGAKSMSEAPYNPVAPALANAIRDAIGHRPMELPMSRDRVWRLIHG